MKSTFSIFGAPLHVDQSFCYCYDLSLKRDHCSNETDAGVIFRQ